MESILICLTSEQRMQNAIPLFQKGRRFNRVFLLVSAENGEANARFEGYARDFIDAFSSRVQCAVYPTPVDPMDPGSTRSTLERLAGELKPTSEVVINFTGGTKPMSIGAFQAGLALGCPMLYVDTQKEQIYTFQRGITSIAPFDLEPISVAQVLVAHGKSIREPENSPDVRAAEGDFDLSAQIAAHAPRSLHLMNLLHEAIAEMQRQEEKERRESSKEAPAAGDFQQKKEREYRFRSCDFQTAPWLADAFIRAGAARTEQETLWLDNPAFRYLNGGWLEKLVYHQMVASGCFHDLRRNIKVTGIDNEIDIACTLNAKLAILECKGGLVSGKAGQPILNRLRALKESLAGAFGKSFLVTTTSADGITSKFRTRANEYVSRIICLEELLDAGRIIYEELSRRRR